MLEGPLCVESLSEQANRLAGSPLEQSPLVLDMQDGVPAVRDVERPGLQLRRHHVRDLEADLRQTHERTAEQLPLTLPTQTSAAKV